MLSTRSCNWKSGLRFCTTNYMSGLGDLWLGCWVGEVDFVVIPSVLGSPVYAHWVSSLCCSFLVCVLLLLVGPFFGSVKVNVRIWYENIYNEKRRMSIDYGKLIFILTFWHFLPITASKCHRLEALRFEVGLDGPTNLMVHPSTIHTIYLPSSM
jgi:hypothetical protein